MNAPEKRETIVVVRRVIRNLGIQILLMSCAPILAAWGAFHLGVWYETAEMMRSAPHDGQAGMSVLAAGVLGAVLTFFLTMRLVYLLIRRVGASSDGC